MINRARGLRPAAVVVLAALLALCAVPALCESADPILVASRSDPQTVVGEQDVDITIRVFNSSQTDLEGEIQLYNPEGGYPIEVYQGLASDQSVTYTGTWHVTQDQIDEGRIKYYIRYSVDTGNGPEEMTRTIPVAITNEAPAPQLSATYIVSPTAAREGETVTLSYTLSNTGNVELRNIVIENEGVTEEDVTVASLSVGEKITSESTIQMGTQELVSNPTVSYEAVDSDIRLTISDMPRRTIAVAEDGLDVTLSGENLTDVYPGESVELAVKLNNTGETAYSDLSIALPDGSVAATVASLAPGETYEGTVQYAPAESGEVSVSVTGKGDSGADIGVASNALEVTTQDPSKALILRVRAQAQETVVYSEPAVVRFAVVVDNIGETDAATLTIKEANTTVATIPSLPFGESRTAVFDVEASIAGKFQFTVTGKDASGNDRTYESNVIEIAYVAPTPAPTDVPEPTAAPPAPTPMPTATPEPSLVERVMGSVNLTALYIAAAVLSGVILIALIVGGVSGARRRKLLKNAIDTIDRTNDARNYRGVRRKKKKGAAKAKNASRPKEEEPIVPTPELTAEERAAKPAAPATPAAKAGPDESAAKQEEPRRRRAAEEPTVTAEETLRVMPVDQRPEFVAQRTVDDSQTRVFSRVKDAPAETRVQRPVREPSPASAPEQAKQPEQTKPSEQGQHPAQEARPAHPQEGGETIRLSSAEINALTKEQDGAKAAAAKKAKAAPGKGSTIKDVKPMKKKKKGLFHRDDEDDFVEDVESPHGGDDDLFD